MGKKEKKKSTFLKDFKAFAMRGNILDLAVGVIIGGAFGKIISSLVSDMIMPIIGLIFGGKDVRDWKWVFTPAELDPISGAVLTAEAALRYGNFIQTIIDFFIIALSIFVLLRLIMKAKETAEKAVKLVINKEHKEEVVVEATPVVEVAAVVEEVAAKNDDAKVTELLTEIRDLLKK